MVALGWWREQREMIIMGHWLSLKVMGTFMGWLWWRLHASMYVNHWLSPCVIFFSLLRENTWQHKEGRLVCLAHSLKEYNLSHGSQFEGIQSVTWLTVWRDTGYCVALSLEGHSLSHQKIYGEEWGHCSHIQTTETNDGSGSFLLLPFHPV